MPVKFGLVAGESSGDLLGAGLIHALRERAPDAIFEGVAGPEMTKAGCARWEESESLAVMGLVEPLKEIPRLLMLRRSLVKRWTSDPPDVFIGIDSPDFNLGLERRLKATGIRTAHYVSPSVWAWRQGRVRKIKKAADCVLCILPFETRFYDEHEIAAVFVGHPKADSAPKVIDSAAARASLGIGGDEPVIAVLPGSRVSEVSRLGPLFAAAAAQIASNINGVQFVTPVATPKLKPIIEKQLGDAGVREIFVLTDGDSELAMTSSDVVLLASGTAALESALLCKPTVAAYQVATMTAAIVKAFGLLKIDRFTLPNLLTESPYVPEFIQNDATPEALATAVTTFVEDPERCAAIAARFAKLRTELAQDANRRAADAVLSLAKHATKTAIED